MSITVERGPMKFSIGLSTPVVLSLLTILVAHVPLA